MITIKELGEGYKRLEKMIVEENVNAALEEIDFLYEKMLERYQNSLSNLRYVKEKVVGLEKGLFLDDLIREIKLEKKFLDSLLEMSAGIELGGKNESNIS